MGVEPTSQAWEARVLPMYYTRVFLFYQIFLTLTIKFSKFLFLFGFEIFIKVEIYCYTIFIQLT